MSDDSFPDTILLAAGLGTRMRPLTDTMPKPLIEVAGRSLLERVVTNCHRECVRRFAVNAHYLPTQIDAALGSLRTRFDNAEFALSLEADTLLNTGGGAKKALNLVQSDPVFVGNTDAFWTEADKPLERMLAARGASANAIVLLCAHPAKAHGFSRSHDFCLDPRGEITFDRGAPVIYAGMALINRALLAGVRQDAFSMNMLFEQALDAGLLRGVMLGGDWYHVGTPDAVDATAAMLEQG